MPRKFKPAFGLLPRIENDPQKREEAIKNDLPVRFEIKRNTQAKANHDSKLWDDIRTFDLLGKNAVREYDGNISRSSQKHNIDPDLVRSVMYAENARGHYLGANYLADKTGYSKSILPMNIQKRRWSSLIDKTPEDLYNADANIEASAVLLRRISDRIDHPTPEKVGTIWNSLKEKETNEFGEYIGQIYQEKPWRKFD